MNTGLWARSSVVERCPDKTEVEGPIPSGPTILCNLLFYIIKLNNIIFIYIKYEF